MVAASVVTNPMPDTTAVAAIFLLRDQHRGFAGSLAQSVANSMSGPRIVKLIPASEVILDGVVRDPGSGQSE